MLFEMVGNHWIYSR